ncbi:MAG: NADP-dependent phosphogluconate dehydrogenase [Gordonia sp. (in: high G+C Gram-positive bacteria)]|uniref:NADP-dependent phosphogluconate dehydrogenase n=1 Tax=Gordonia sp. (in: high G+C Gram-positive bacteria) TaxID=84139 RepID=UPI0039E35470
MDTSTNKTTGAAPIGIVGTGVMGASLARNLARNVDGEVAMYDLDQTKIDALLAAHGDEGLIGFSDLPDFVAALRTSPRVILLMVPAGGPVDAAIGSLTPLLGEGDIIIDGGNSHYPDTERRYASCAENGIRFIGMGVSGGEQGALLGPALMPGGDPSVWADIAPLLEPIAAKADDGAPCVTLCGSGASGHFTKMVHNGIEYADLQLIAEAYAVLRAGGRTGEQVGAIFGEWNDGEGRSYLLESAATVLAQTDPQTGGELIEKVLDQAKGKGTGAWTVIAAAEQGVSVSVIAEALFARSTSSAKDERAAWLGAADPVASAVDLDSGDVEQAYLAARLIAYQQGLSLLRVASDHFGWDIPLAEVVRIWRAGCIIRAGFLDDVAAVYAEHPDTASFLAVEPFRSALLDRYRPLGEVAAAAMRGGVPVPAHAAAFNHQTMLTSGSLPTALVQLLRDFFGSHTYERTDADGHFHIAWEDDRREIRS